VTDQRNDSVLQEGNGVETVNPPATTEPLSRRDLLRGVYVAAPTILTLSSASAAAAMTSVRTYTSKDAPIGNNYYCLAEESTAGSKMSANQLQISQLQSPVVYQIPERDYHTSKDNSVNSAIGEVQMCRNSNLTGTSYYYNDGGWKGVKVKRGILLSQSAYTSLGVAASPLDPSL
jgi:hypothetical protein